MKNPTSFSTVLYCSLFFLFCITASCSTDLASPQSADQIENKQINDRTDFSGLEAQVRNKIAARDQISADIVFTHYDGTTSQGYGKYPYTTLVPSSGIFIVTGIIGDDVEGW